MFNKLYIIIVVCLSTIIALPANAESIYHHEKDMLAKFEQCLEVPKDETVQEFGQSANFAIYFNKDGTLAKPVELKSDSYSLHDEKVIEFYKAVEKSFIECSPFAFLSEDYPQFFEYWETTEFWVHSGKATTIYFPNAGAVLAKEKKEKLDAIEYSTDNLIYPKQWSEATLDIYIPQFLLSIKEETYVCDSITEIKHNPRNINVGLTKELINESYIITCDGDIKYDIYIFHGFRTSIHTPLKECE